MGDADGAGLSPWGAWNKQEKEQQQKQQQKQQPQEPQQHVSLALTPKQQVLPQHQASFLFNGYRSAGWSSGEVPCVSGPAAPYSPATLRQLFLADQQLVASSGFTPTPAAVHQSSGHSGASGAYDLYHAGGAPVGLHRRFHPPQRQHPPYLHQHHRSPQLQDAADSSRRGSTSSSSNGALATASSSSESSCGSGSRGLGGWGGQVIREPVGFRTSSFGRNGRQGGGAHRAQQHHPPPPLQHRNYGHGGRQQEHHLGSHRGAGGGGAATGSGEQHGHGVRGGDDFISVEELERLIKRLLKHEPIPERVYHGLYLLDSRAVSVLLKDLSKSHAEARAVELFDWLRSLPPRHPLSMQCDVYTYTAMIATCTSVEHAFELFEEMRERGVERNVHSFTALMNVCIKAGKLALALDVYANMRTSGCTPNVVTFNTLVDVYGKLGQWETSVSMLRVMKGEGIQPVLRTFNTLIIACNMCNQPREALSVYQDMITQGFTANSTTSNALISAYGKLGQLDKVLEVYQDMVRKGLDRSVITYSSLISACEKAGKWEIALRLFEEMKQDGCEPNTVTYNSLITACAQGAQWERASQVLAAMQAQGCTPDVVTYTALITAFDRGGQWHLALQAFEQMCAQGCKPDAIVYNAIIDTLWETGVSWAQSTAFKLYRTAVSQGHFRQQSLTLKSGRAELNLHALTAGVAMLSLFSWFQEIRQQVYRGGGSPSLLPSKLAVVTDAGSASREQGNFVIREAVAALLSFWGSAFRGVQDGNYSGVLEAGNGEVAQWCSSSDFDALLSSTFPFSNESSALTSQDALAHDLSVKNTCADAIKVVQQFEGSHCLALQNMSLTYLQQRSALVSQMLRMGAQFGLRDEVVHDSVLLLDRIISCAAEANDVNTLELAATAALLMTARQSSADPLDEQMAEATGCTVGLLKQTEWSIDQILGQDVSAISTLRCLKTYFERLGVTYLGPQAVYGMAGLPTILAVESLFDVSMLNCRPSVIAAAILYTERRQRGMVPFWPSVLSKMTGYEDLTTPELALAVRSALKMCRKVMYVRMYRAQAASLHTSAPELRLHAPTSAAPLPGSMAPLVRDAAADGGGDGSGSGSTGPAVARAQLPPAAPPPSPPWEAEAWEGGALQGEEPAWLLGVRALSLGLDEVAAPPGAPGAAVGVAQPAVTGHAA